MRLIWPKQNLRMKILLYVGASNFLCTGPPSANMAYDLKTVKNDFCSSR